MVWHQDSRGQWYPNSPFVRVMSMSAIFQRSLVTHVHVRHAMSALCPYFKTKAFPRLQCISLWMAGIMFFRIVHMSDWHCESRADSGMENDRDGCLGLEIQCHSPVLWPLDDKSIKDRGSATSEDLQKESCYTWRRNLEPVCLSDHCSPLLPHVKKVHLQFLGRSTLKHF